MKKKSWRILLPVFVLLLLVALRTTALADVGGGVDWNTDNWGGDLGGGFDDFGGGGGGISLNPFLLVGLLNNPMGIVIIITLVAFKVLSNRKNPRSTATRRPAPTPMSTRKASAPADLSKLKEEDPKFSEPAFLSRAGDVFVALQQAWTAKDWRSIRPFEANHLYTQHERQLQDYIDKGLTNVVEDISIMNTTMEKFEEDAENNYLSAIVEARYRDYVVDDATQKVVKGNKEKRYIMTYRMQFMRQKGAKTESSVQTQVTECPNCGAPLSINQNGICEYCGSEVTTGANQWVLTALQPLQQRAA